ncbi:SA1320 family protein [Metabacillus idriensis]|uniref:SA1320 family protein n=1 Tax=Metabacillus idriensis TaxID=324768 RepID=UPI00174C4FBA|nr:hypothetical protein [Metabacillus idriensis]
MKKPGISTVKVNEVNGVDSTISDKDLVELAGYHAYRSFDVDETITVNGRNYTVVNTKYNQKSGLDALTVQNYETGEYTVVYVGTNPSQKQDLLTDFQLMSDLTPAQIADARAYFNEMDKKYQRAGGIKSMSGNSLGGALVGSVAIEHPDVKAVTLNPALLPAGMMEPDMEYSHITNYFSSYDPLTKGLSGLDLHSRIPGHQYEIFNGIPVPAFEHLGTNHTGYLRKDDGSQSYKIGMPGQPGAGEIFIDADAHIVTSLWTGSPLYGGNTDYIEINKENLMLLAERIDSQVKARVATANDYLANSAEIIDDEGIRLYQRISMLQQIFEDSFENSIGDPIFIGITSAGSRLKGEIDDLISLLERAEGSCRSLNSVLNSPPAELMEHVFNVDVSVEGLFGKARNQLCEMRDEVDGLSRMLGNVISDLIPDLFKGGTDLWYDAVVGELRAHFDIINGNKDKLVEHIEQFKTQVNGTADSFESRDHSIGESIRAGAEAADEAGPVPKTTSFVLEESPYLKVGMRIKEVQLDLAFTAFTGFAYSKVFPFIVALKTLTELIELTLEGISSAIKGAAYLGVNHTLPGKLISMFTDFDDKITAYVHNTLKPLDEMAAAVEGIRDGAERLMIQFPTLVSNFRPYLDQAIFNATSYANVQLYNLAAFAILREMEMTFSDVVTQLGQNKANAIEALCDVSQKVTSNMGILGEQVDRGTMN